MSGFIYTHLTVEEQPVEGKRKTPDYHVMNCHSGNCIGVLKWYGPWRQFCFYPGDDTVWSADCLEDIQDALRRIKSGGKLT